MSKEKFNVILITQGISRVFIPLVESKYNIVGVIESAPREYKSKKLIYRLIFVFKFILFFLTKKKLNLYTYCKSLNLPYFFMTSSDDLALEGWIKEKNTDLIVVFSMSQLLKRNIFSIPRYGTINLHPSYLPDYRGPNPDFWQYHDMVMNPGVTIHYIDEGEDTGPIIKQDRINIKLGLRSPDRNSMLVQKLGVDLLLEAMEMIAQGNVEVTIQPEISGTKRATNLLTNEHTEIIDWNEWPVERVWHLLRGTEQWLNCIPRPTGFYKYQRWEIEGFTRNRTSFNDIPGQIYKRNKQYWLSAKDGEILIKVRFKFVNVLKGFIGHV